MIGQRKVSLITINIRMVEHSMAPFSLPDFDRKLWIVSRQSLDNRTIFKRRHLGSDVGALGRLWQHQVSNHVIGQSKTFI